jgi:hypothetical protein
MYRFRKGNLDLLSPPPAKTAAAGEPAWPPEAADVADEVPALKLGRCIDCLNLRAVSGRLDGRITSYTCQAEIGGPWRVEGKHIIGPPLTAWHWCLGFVERVRVAAKGGQP